MWSSCVAEQAAQQSPGAAVQTSCTSTAMAVLPLFQATAQVQNFSRVRAAVWEAPGQGKEADWEHLSWPPFHGSGHTHHSAVMTICSPVLMFWGEGGKPQGITPSHGIHSAGQPLTSRRKVCP